MSDVYIDMFNIHTVFGYTDVLDYRDITTAELDELVALHNSKPWRWGWDKDEDSLVIFNHGYGGSAAEELLDKVNAKVGYEWMTAARDEYIEKGGERWGEVADYDGISVEITDENGRYTRAFRYAVWLLTCVRDYPMLDEQEYSDAEMEAQNENYSEELDYALREIDDDEEAEAIRDFIFTGERSDELDEMISAAIFDSISELYVDGDAVTRIVEQAREEMYIAKGREQLTAQIEGQMILV